MSDSSAEDTVSAADTTTWPQQTPIDGPKTERPAAASCCFADTDSLRDVLCACQSLISPVDHADRPVAAVDYPEREACSFVARASTGGCGGSLNTSASRPISSPIKVGYRSSGLSKSCDNSCYTRTMEVGMFLALHSVGRRATSRRARARWRRRTK